jgi:hypothetical protein
MNLEEEQREMRNRVESLKKIEQVPRSKDNLCAYCQKVALDVDEMFKPCKRCKQVIQLLKKYDITIFKYYSLLKEQDWRCAICRVKLDSKNKTTTPCVDHCHDLKHVRGILCGNCNLGLGVFQDDDIFLTCAAKYLKMNRLERRWWTQAADVESM